MERRLTTIPQGYDETTKNAKKDLRKKKDCFVPRNDIEGVGDSN
jgi:hypothetical protein